MGSRIMHLAVAKGVAEALKIPYEPFAFGNLIVDAHMNREEKKVSHYTIEGAGFHAERILDEDKFRSQYRDMLGHPVYLGYYSHLVTDHIWLKTVYVPTMVNDDGTIKKALVEDYYKDYGILNPILIQHYGLSKAMKAYHHGIEAVNPDIVPDILADLEKDFTTRRQGTLKVMDLQTIHKFIEASIEAVIKALEV